MRPALSISAVLIVTALWAAYFVLPHIRGDTGLTDRTEYRLLDLKHRLAGPSDTGSLVSIVAIDDATLASGNQGKDGRTRLAQIIENIAKSDASVLALDVVLADAGDARTDARLAAALSSVPSAIAQAAIFDAQGMTLLEPHDPFRSVARTGLVNLSADPGGTPRFAPLIFVSGGGVFASLPLQAAQMATGATAEFKETGLTLGSRRIALDTAFSLPVRHAGPQGTVPTVSARDLLSEPRPDLLAGHVVVLGFTASAMGDRFPTPFQNSLPGVEIIATVVSQLIDAQGLRRTDTVRLLDGAHASLLAVLSVVALLVLPLSRGGIVVAGLFGASLTAGFVAFLSGWWVSAALPLWVAGPPAVLTGVLRYLHERKAAGRAEQAADALRRFQSPALAEKIAADPDYLRVPQEQSLIVLFVDLTGFTGLSQKLGQEGTRVLLRDFHERTAAAVETHGGAVLNYMGDGALAVFGLEQGNAPETATDALSAAFALARALEQANGQREKEAPPACRIGLHAGPVTLSRLGSDSHQQVTVTGDTVNLASRLMEVAKTEQAVIAASADFAAQLPETAVLSAARRLEVPIRGRDGQVGVLAFPANAVRQV